MKLPENNIVVILSLSRSATAPSVRGSQTDCHTSDVGQKVNCAKRKRGWPGPLVRNDRFWGFDVLFIVALDGKFSVSYIVTTNAEQNDVSLRASAHTGVAICLAPSN